MFKNQNNTKIKHFAATKQCRSWWSTIVVTLLLSAILNMGVAAGHRTLLQQGIADEVLRFHVLANSDSEEDQKVKLLVRDEVLGWIAEQMEEDAAVEADAPSVAISDDGDGRAKALKFVSSHLEQIEENADRVLAAQGFSYRATAALEYTYFPERTYGEYTFPAGWYEALCVSLGEAKGHNWWCILYPNLCFSDSLHGVIEEEEVQQLEEALTVEEYDSLLHQPGKWKLSFRWLTWLNKEE